jgi:hypothetical protein
MVFGGKTNIAQKILESFTIDEDTIGYGEIDKTTNKLVRKIPRYFVNQDTEKEVSTDLFKNLAIYNQAINNYKELDELEGVVLAIGRTEQNKNSIQTSYWGRPKRNPDSGELETIEDNAKNFDLYEKQLATLWYGQKYIQSDQFDILLGKVGPVVNKINDFLGFDLFPRSMDNRQLSMVKFIDALNNLFQQKTIGLNPLPSISNYFGGNANAIINSGRYFTKEDFIVSEMELTNLAIKGEKGKKMLAAIEYFMPFTDDMNRELARKLSLTFISDESIQDALFIMMRKLDRVVQASIFFALLKNQIFIDGKVVSARDYLRQKPEFKGKHISAEFEKAVKELIKQHGLLNVAELKDGKLVLPETERQSPEVFKIRNFTREITKKALGNMSPEEVRGVQQNILWRSAMIFKNWIPPLADVRFGEMKYNSALDAYEWGRARALFRFVLTNGIKSITNLRGAVLGNKEGMEQLQKLYEYKKKDYEEKTGKKFEMDEESFTDLVRENISSAGKDAIGMVLLVSLLITAHLAAPDDDEDDQTKNIHKFTVRALDKLTDELTFFYLPTSASQLLNSSIFPSIGVLTDILSVFNHFGKEIYGMTFDEELQERNHVIKYILKNFPIASQLSSYMPLYAPDMAKDLGIKMSTQSRR